MEFKITGTEKNPTFHVKMSEYEIRGVMTALAFANTNIDTSFVLTQTEKQRAISAAQSFCDMLKRGADVR